MTYFTFLLLFFAPLVALAFFLALRDHRRITQLAAYAPRFPRTHCVAGACAGRRHLHHALGQLPCGYQRLVLQPGAGHRRHDWFGSHQRILPSSCCRVWPWGCCSPGWPDGQACPGIEPRLRWLSVAALGVVLAGYGRSPGRRVQARHLLKLDPDMGAAAAHAPALGWRRYLWQHRRAVFGALAPMTLYLALADTLAISQGTWTIAPAQSLQIYLGGILPSKNLSSS